jgi:hypothetical protein
MSIEATRITFEQIQFAEVNQYQLFSTIQKA